MPNKIKLEVITPYGKIIEKEVKAVQAATKEGGLSVWADHAPLMCQLDICSIAYDYSDDQDFIACSGGFMEVIDNLVTILAHSAELAEDIDEARAVEARKRAEKRLEERRKGTNIVRAEASLRRALNRLKVAKK